MEMRISLEKMRCLYKMLRVTYILREENPKYIIVAKIDAFVAEKEFQIHKYCRKGRAQNVPTKSKFM